MKIWPYVLPLPTNKEKQLKYLLAVFGSDITVSILKRIPLKGKAYQGDLIKSLPYSNKTVINHLKALVALGVLKEGMEKIIRDGRSVWVKWYSPTNLGRWIVLLLSPHERIDKNMLREAINELFRMYIRRILELCYKYDLDVNFLQAIFKEELNRSCHLKQIKRQNR